MLKSKRQRLEEAEVEESDYERRFCILNIGLVLAELVRKMSEMKNDHEGNDWLPEIDIPFKEITVADISAQKTVVIHAGLFTVP